MFFAFTRQLPPDATLGRFLGELAFGVLLPSSDL